MNLKDTLESLIHEAMNDEQELIPTDQLPSALLIAAHIQELEGVLQEIADGVFCDLRSVEEYAQNALDNK